VEPRPIITLTSDFGAGPFVGLMKGVIWGVCPRANIVDLCHSVAAQDVWGGAVVMAEALASFEPGAVHVAVVDPGVGTARRGLCLRAGGQLFVGPDNGLFTVALQAPGGWRAWRLDNRRFFRQSVSDTFHGRDIFAPVAAWLARGVAPEELGPAVDDPICLDWPRPQRSGQALIGRIIDADRFGNLTSNLGRELVLGFLAGAPASVTLEGPGGPLVIEGLSRAYGQAPPGRAVALFDSLGRLELAQVNGDLAAALGLGPGRARGLELRIGRGARPAG